MIRIDRVTTRGGDRGETSLGCGKRVRKDSLRIVAIGEVDELNCLLGNLRTIVSSDRRCDAILDRVQHGLFDLGADLCIPGTDATDAKGRTRNRVSERQTRRLEAEAAEMGEGLPALRSFVLPGGSPAAAEAHVARAVARCTERAVVALDQDEAVSEEAIRYLNRLSDLLFQLARPLNGDGRSDVLWRAGAIQ